MKTQRNQILTGTRITIDNSLLSIDMVIRAVFFFGFLLVSANAWEYVSQGNNECFPVEWRVGQESEIQFFDSLDPRIDLIKNQINIESKKYTEKILKNIKKIFLLKELNLGGCDYGGTYFENNILIYGNRSDKDFLREKVSQTFHHELSSVLLKNHPWAFDKKKWELCNPDGFNYGKGGLEFLKGGGEVKYNDAFIEDGFITTYSMSGIEDDFNVLCEHIFSGKNYFYETLKQKPSVKLGKKIAIVKKFFTSIDPSFQSAEIEFCLRHALSRKAGD